eukprot:m.14254 g.14254  ORF g.14254 m.14254 type:complete len:438 (+) comp6179_c0_seq1:483-1796(+)
MLVRDLMGERPLVFGAGVVAGGLGWWTCSWLLSRVRSKSASSRSTVQLEASSVPEDLEADVVSLLLRACTLVQNEVVTISGLGTAKERGRRQMLAHLYVLLSEYTGDEVANPLRSTTTPQSRRRNRIRTASGRSIRTRDSSVAASDDGDIFYDATDGSEDEESDAEDGTGAFEQQVGALSPYQKGVELAEEGITRFRRDRTEELHCTDVTDFMARLYCVRRGTSVLFSDPEKREWLVAFGTDTMCNLLQFARADVTAFRAAFRSLVDWLTMMEETDRLEEVLAEMAPRGVVCLSLYDAVLDFVLLDAFDDMKKLPSSVVNVLKSKWVPMTMKQQAIEKLISTTVEKKLETSPKGGLFERFYAVMRVLSPSLACGLLDCTPYPEFNNRCQQFKTVMTDLACAWFQFDAQSLTTDAELATAFDAVFQDVAEKCKGVVAK